MRYCKHVDPTTLPKPGDPAYKGFEVCPYCGKRAPMFTRFRKVEEGEEDEDRKDREKEKEPIILK